MTNEHSVLWWIRKSVSWTASVVVVVGFLAVLAFAHGPAELPDDRQGYTILRYWEKWTNFEELAMEKIVKQYNDTEGRKKHVFVEYLSMSLIEQKTLIAIAAGDPPDIAGLYDLQVGPYSSRDALLPMDELAKNGPYGPITADYYKPIYWEGCHYDGKLYALVSTPATTALFYNKRIFHEQADKLRAAGCDPDRPPQTLDELDKYATALDEYTTDAKGVKHYTREGYLPMEPGWWPYAQMMMFGSNYWDDVQKKFLIDSPASIAAYTWMQSYSTKLGSDAVTEFNNAEKHFDSPLNPFMTGEVVMEMQGPWFPNFINMDKPEMARWNVPPDQLQREQDFLKIPAPDPDTTHHDEAPPGGPPMTLADVQQLLGPGDPPSAGCDPPAVPPGTQMFRWLAGIKDIYVSFVDGNAVSKTWTYRPADERMKYSEWDAAPFPSAVGEKNISWASFDTLSIPRGAKYPEKSFDFIAYVNRQDIMEALCRAHTKNSPLAKVSPGFFVGHPNPRIDLFESLASSPNVRTVLPCPLNTEVFNEMTATAQEITLGAPVKETLTAVQNQLQSDYDTFAAREAARNKNNTD